MQHALDATGENYVAHSYLGVARLAHGDAAGAVAHWRDAARIEPGYATVANNLAWLLATHPDPALRDGDEAVRLGERAAALTRDTAEALDTLAAAYAEAGRTDAAVSTGERALAGARVAGQETLATQIETRLTYYRAGRAWREVPPRGH
jgi:serine/threonine-protein kinase